MSADTGNWHVATLTIVTKAHLMIMVISPALGRLDAHLPVQSAVSTAHEPPNLGHATRYAEVTARPKIGDSRAA